MAARKSSHDRLEKLRAEAAATEREKEEKRKAKAAAPKKAAKKKAAPKKAAAKKAAPKKRTRASAKKPARMMVVWTVCTPKGEELETYPYAKKSEAEADCRKRGTAKGTAYTLLRKKVPFVDPATVVAEADEAAAE